MKPGTVMFALLDGELSEEGIDSLGACLQAAMSNWLDGFPHETEIDVTLGLHVIDDIHDVEDWAQAAIDCIKEKLKT